MAAKHTKKEVIEYIKEELDSGQSVEHIKSHLMSYGHESEELEKYFDKILKQEEIVKSKTVSRAVEILYVVIFVMFIFWVGASAKSPGETVFLGFAPTLLFIVLTIILVERYEHSDTIMTILPVVLAFFFFLIGSMGGIPSFENMEIGKLTVLNLLLSYIFLFALKYSEFVSKLTSTAKEAIPEAEEIEEQVIETKEIPAAPQPEFIEVQEGQEPLDKIISNIESNAKALNSVIGRVYRKSNGGTNLIRELIHIKKEWYNEFNTLLKTMDKEKITEIIDKIEKRLNIMFRTEKELFGNTKFKNLKRDPDGKSRIIDVLIMNDNDPVETYFESALISCGKARERL